VGGGGWGWGVGELANNERKKQQIARSVEAHRCHCDSRQLPPKNIGQEANTRKKSCANLDIQSLVHYAPFPGIQLHTPET
jgi:hypothetical protein